MSDIEKLKFFLENEEIKSKRSSYSGFKDIGTIYLSTNEDLTMFKPKNLENKNVITVTASGDQILHFIMLGAKNIDAFDINVFAKYVAMLKVAMVKMYEQRSYFAYYNSLYSPKILKMVIDDVSNYLSKDALDFWNYYIFFMEHQEEILSSNALNDSLHGGWKRSLFEDVANFSFQSNMEICSYRKEDQYNRLKSNIIDAKINYIDSSLEELSLKTSHRYDGIYTSNVIQRIYYFYSTFSSDFNKEARDMVYKTLHKLEDVIENDGVIWDYYFGLSDNRLGDYDDKLFERENDFIQRFNIEKEFNRRGKIFTYKKRGKKD